MGEYGYVRIGAIVPKLKVANVEFNVDELIREIKNADNKGVSIVVTPELSLTGYTAADLFLQSSLLETSIEGLERLVEETRELNIISIIGMPIVHENRLYNAAVVIERGNILGVVPKSSIPNYSEFYEKRWFSSGEEIKNHEVEIGGKSVPIGTNLLFRDVRDCDICFGIEICEDLWGICPPSSHHAVNGATMIFNLSASNEVIGKYQYRKELIKGQSARTISAYCYASSGIHESSTDLVFSGHAMIAEEGHVLAENKRFAMDSNLIIADVDISKLKMDRIRKNTYMDNCFEDDYQFIKINVKDRDNLLERVYAMYPFVPSNSTNRDARCEEIFSIQASGLMKRLMHTGIKTSVIGISGGLDSTLAFLVILEAYKRLGISPKNIIGVTMPGFGTTDRTYDSARRLVKEAGATLREVSIKDACLQHFRDIGISADDRSVVYENSQARERTQILMDIANKENGLVIGTGDLSELALGWCTYNGDHMSNYGVNASIPKTLVRYLVEWKMNQMEGELVSILKCILDTPISPELLPPDEEGKIKQLTENSIGPYVLHDFFLYHFMRNGFSPEKIYYLAKYTFCGKYSDEEIKKWLLVFFKRFFSQQFKRSCLPDGPKVGTVSLSPRGDFRMPSDASCEDIIRRIKKL